MALEIVTGFQIEMPVLPACVTAGASLNLRFFSAQWKCIHDRVGTQGFWSGCLSLLPCLSISL